MASSHHGQSSIVVAAATSTTTASANQSNVISKKNLQSLAKIVDPNVQLDEEVEDMLLAYSDDFLEEVIEGACRLAVHRKSGHVESQDVETYTERNYNMWVVTGNGGKEDSIKPVKKGYTADAHKQRVALIKKTMKKY